MNNRTDITHEVTEAALGSLRDYKASLEYRLDLSDKGKEELCEEFYNKAYKEHEKALLETNKK
jgi:hypothetical protein